MGSNKEKADIPAFVPSTGDEDYLNPEKGSFKREITVKGWTAGQDALSLQTLTNLSKEIGQVIDSTHKALAKGQIKVGHLLLAAREKFKGDKEFGQWRKECTPIESARTANSLMAVARTFGQRESAKLVDACNFSVLRELVYAPEEVVSEIAAAVAAGEPPPTVKEIAKAKRLSGPRVPGSGNFMTNKKDAEPRDVEAEAVDMLYKSLTARLNHKNNYVKLGLYPFGGPPALSVLQAIDYYSEQQLEKEEIDEYQFGEIQKAINAVNKEIPKS